MPLWLWAWYNFLLNKHFHELFSDLVYCTFVLIKIEFMTSLQYLYWWQNDEKRINIHQSDGNRNIDHFISFIVVFSLSCMGYWNYLYWFDIWASYTTPSIFQENYFSNDKLSLLSKWFYNVEINFIELLFIIYRCWHDDALTSSWKVQKSCVIYETLFKSDLGR